MKYWPPYGSTDPNASYVNGDPATGVEGSIPDCRGFEQPQREILAVIVAAGLTPDETVLTQLRDALGKLYAPAKARYWMLKSPSGTIPASIDTRMANWASLAAYMPASTINASAGTITIGAADAGVYAVGAGSAVLQATSIDIIGVRINGGSGLYQSMQSPADVTLQDPGCAGILVFAAGDVIDATYFQARSGGGSNTLVSSDGYFAAARIGVL